MGVLHEQFVQPMLDGSEAGELVADRVWIVPSDTDDEKWYLVARVPVGAFSNYFCQCEGWRYSSDDSCRHIRKVRKGE